ncbi:MAG: Crp/Fnr family transcriptional regulator [Ignavibacteria bacterium]|nr:Crp/Fnr family transcriptional regulator [Ignavibacteria bacterium]
MASDNLKKVYIFSGLDDNELDKISKIVKVKTFNKGDIIFFDTEPYKGFYINSAGLVKIYKISKDGKEHILHLITANNTFAEVPLFENLSGTLSGNFGYPANAMAIEDNTRVVLVPARLFLEMLESNTKICIKMCAGFAKRLRHLNNHIEELTLKDVSRRVAGYIINERRSEEQNKISLSISKNDLSSYLGTIPETLSRTLKKLQDEGMIEVDGKVIRITDAVKLKQYSE